MTASPQEYVVNVVLRVPTLAAAKNSEELIRRCFFRCADAWQSEIDSRVLARPSLKREELSEYITLAEARSRIRKFAEDRFECLALGEDTVLARFAIKSGPEFDCVLLSDKTRTLWQVFENSFLVPLRGALIAARLNMGLARVSAEHLSSIPLRVVSELIEAADTLTKASTQLTTDIFWIEGEGVTPSRDSKHTLS